MLSPPPLPPRREGRTWLVGLPSLVEALRAQVGQLSVLIATKIIEKELDEEEQEKLIQEYVQESGGRL